jgi:FAD/FMN-containing dehydrogenase
MTANSRIVSSWGRLSADRHRVVELHDPQRIAQALATHAPGIAHGMGRSYGDVCLNPNGVLWSTARLDRFIRFDDASGRLHCESGVLLRDIQRMAIPRGWNLAVVPGTQLVTVGGAIANDVHGKNHHLTGTFGDHVAAMKLVRTNGEIIECGPEQRRDWFAATVGGLGLTGLIVDAELQLRPTTGPWLDTETIPFLGLDAFFQLSDESISEWEHTVSWIDCTRGANARGLFMRAKAADRNEDRVWREHERSVPFMSPFSLVNRATLRPLNSAYYHFKKRRSGRNIVHYQPFLYPLDSVQHWNRLYGPRGFYQYQCGVPPGSGAQAILEMLDAVAASGEGSVLAVLKTFGNRQAPGMLSFARPGVTLALDFRNTAASLRLFERLDAIVREAGGGIYPAKDARMPKSLFEAAYPRLEEFLPYRDRGMSSGLSRRLMGN